MTKTRSRKETTEMVLALYDGLLENLNVKLKRKGAYVDKKYESDKSFPRFSTVNSRQKPQERI